VAIDANEVAKINHLRQHFVKIESTSVGEVIDVKWSMAILNVPFYPESRVFRGTKRYVCSRGIPNEDLVFLEFKRSGTVKIKPRLASVTNSGHV
jgi:hypothetical protein